MNSWDIIGLYKCNYFICRVTRFHFLFSPSILSSASASHLQGRPVNDRGCLSPVCLAVRLVSEIWESPAFTLEWFQADAFLPTWLKRESIRDALVLTLQTFDPIRCLTSLKKWLIDHFVCFIFHDIPASSGPSRLRRLGELFINLRVGVLIQSPCRSVLEQGIDPEGVCVSVVCVCVCACVCVRVSSCVSMLDPLSIHHLVYQQEFHQEQFFKIC